MSLDVSISSRAEQDMTLQHRWYLENADSDILRIERIMHGARDLPARLAAGRPSTMTYHRTPRNRSLQRQAPQDRPHANDLPRPQRHHPCFTRGKGGDVTLPF